MNQIILRGRAVKAPEIRYFENEGESKAIAKFHLAVNRIFRKGEKTADFFSCVAFGKYAKVIEAYVKKGTQLLITGRMENNDYEIDGCKIYGYTCVIEAIEFLDKKADSHILPAEDENGFLQIPEDEMPFR